MHKRTPYIWEDGVSEEDAFAQAKCFEKLHVAGPPRVSRMAKKCFSNETGESSGKKWGERAFWRLQRGEKYGIFL